MKTNMTAAEIIWETPPPKSSRNSQSDTWVDRLSPLVEKPGEWARVWEGAVSTARSYTTSLRSRKFPIPNPGDSWSFVSRSLDTDKTRGRLYACYVGETDEASPKG